MIYVELMNIFIIILMKKNRRELDMYQIRKHRGETNSLLYTFNYLPLLQTLQKDTSVKTVGAIMFK